MWPSYELNENIICHGIFDKEEFNIQKKKDIDLLCYRYLNVHQSIPELPVLFYLIVFFFDGVSWL